MPLPTLLPHLVFEAAERWPEAVALRAGGVSLSYSALCERVLRCASGLLALGLARGARVVVWLDKSPEMVEACFGASAAGGIFVPANPVLKPGQVSHLLIDSGAQILITSAARLALLAPELASCSDLRQLVITDDVFDMTAVPPHISPWSWSRLPERSGHPKHVAIDQDAAAILYTSGSTGRPKGVVLSHRNLLAGAASVVSYLGNRPGDTLLAALPLSFDAGFSQLTTGFLSGASVVLLNYLMPRDVLKALERERVTGLTAVPPLYIQLAQLEWPAAIGEHLRYFANTGGHLPREVLTGLRRRVPCARPFLMYGLTEAFRSTYLPPDEVDRRPDSIGKAIPNAEILVLRPDGSPCEVDEPGELVHRGVLVGLGYWNDPAKTAERYRPLPAVHSGLPLPEIAVFSGDTVRRDQDGFLYFIGRNDEMIKSSGYRISPTEVEEVLYSTGLVGECAAFGLPDPRVGQTVAAVATPAGGCTVDAAMLVAACKLAMPAYMVPSTIDMVQAPLPRSPNGKIDRQQLAHARRGGDGG